MAPQDRSGQVLAVAILFTALTWITVSLRIYTRRLVLNSFGVDDHAMVVCFVLFNAYLVCQYGGVAYGTGRHRDVLTDANAQIALRYWFLCEVFYALSTTAMKIAIGFFLLRVAQQPVHIWIIRLIMICSVIAGTIYTGIITFQCSPVSYWWDLSPDSVGHCLSASTVVNTSYVISALNSCADWVFGTLPFFIVKDLQMMRSTKRIVSGILGLAAIGSAATIVRMPYLWTVKHYKGDFLYRTVDVAIWTTVEVGIGITAGCIATLRPLLQEIQRPGSSGATAYTPTIRTVRLNATFKGSGHDPTRNLGYDQQDYKELGPLTSKAGPVTTVTSKFSKHNKDTSWFEQQSTRHPSEEAIRSSPDWNEVNANEFDFSAALGGISRSIEVTTVEERRPSKGNSTDDNQTSSVPTTIHEDV